MRHPTASQLAQIPMLGRVAEGDLARLAAVGQLRDYARGDLIFDEGDPSDFFFVVVTGRVKVFKHTPAGSDLILEIFGAGGPLGAVAAYESRPYPAAAAALEDTSCLLFPRDTFLALLEQHPSLVRGLLSSLSIRLVELTTRLTELTGGRIETRFARLFLKLGDRLGRPHRDGTFIDLALSRQELADLAGTTIETAIRVMSRWSKERVVLTESDGFVIVNRKALEDVGTRS